MIPAMKMTLDGIHEQNLVTRLDSGVVGIGAREYRSSVVVCASTVIEDWPVRQVADLAAGLEAVLDLRPDILVLGTGETQEFPPPALLARITGRRVGFEVMDNRAACRTYNVLRAESRNVVLALIQPES
jgi:uncharacterized protein